MKNRKFNTLVSLLSTFFMMVAMASCVEPIAVTPPEVDEDVEITFRIAVSGAAGIFTKADDTVLAVDKEATIYDLQIWAFAKDGSSSETAVGYAHPDDIPAEGWDPTDPNAQVPTIKMKLKKNTQRTPNEMVLSNTTLVFYALANGPSVGISNLTAPSQDDLKGKTITQFGNTQSTTQDAPATGGLPMTCFEGAGFSIEFLQYGLSTTQINDITGCSGTYNETDFDTQLNNITGLANYQKAYLKTLFKINDNEYKWDAEKVRPTLSLERAVSKIRFVFAKGTNMGETVTNINSIVFTGDNDDTNKKGIPSETYVFSRSPFLPTGATYTTITWEGPTEETVQQPLVASDNIKKDSNPLRLRKTSEIDAGAGKAPKDMNAQEYENFLTTWMGDDKDKTQKVIYLRESDQDVVCRINYTISDPDNPKSRDITLPKGEGNFLRNHGWTIFAYFVSYELQFQITLNPWSVSDDSIHLWEH